MSMISLTQLGVAEYKLTKLNKAVRKVQRCIMESEGSCVLPILGTKSQDIPASAAVILLFKSASC